VRFTTAAAVAPPAVAETTYVRDPVGASRSTRSDVAAQERGEVRTRADNQHARGPGKLDDLGLDSRRVYRRRR
jgi:hypothetical protein